MKMFVVFDGRARTDEDAATPLLATGCIDEARFVAKEHGDAVVFSYDAVGTELVNGKLVFDALVD